MRFLLALSFAGIMLVAPAQVAEIADQSSDRLGYYRVIELSDGRLACASITKGIGVRHIDGSLAWQMNDSYMTAPGLGDMIATPDGGLVQVGSIDGCDVWGNGRIRRFWDSGVEAWELSPLPPGQEAWSNDFHILAKTLPWPDWEWVAAASSEAVVIVDHFWGEQVGLFVWEGSDIQKLHWASDTTLYVVDGTDLKLTDLNGVVLSETPVGEEVTDLKVFATQLFVLAGDSIRRFTASLEPSGSTVVTGAGEYSSFVSSGNSLYLQSGHGLYHLDVDGTANLLFTWPTLPAYTHGGCFIRNNTVHEVGYTNVQERYTSVFRTLSMNGDAAEHHPDVEVLIQVDSAWTVPSSWAANEWDRKAVVTAHVVNHGPDTLRSVLVTLHGVVWFSMYCEVLHHQLNPTDLAVAPGDTIALSFGEVYVAKELWNSMAQDPAWEVCITALAPDELADRDPDDNHACTMVDFIFLGMEEPDPSAALLLAPNPADGLVTVTGNAMLGVPLHLRILDGTGRLVMEESVLVPDGRTELDVSSLPPGTYILDARGSRARSTAKLMVVRP